MGSTTPFLATTGAALVCAALTCGACAGRTRVRGAIRELDRRLVDATPYLGAIAVVFLLRRVTHDASVRVSLALDWDITDAIYAIEGGFVARLQALVPDALVPFFSVVYMVGFPYLLVGAGLVYLLSESLRALKELLVAYALTYVVGSVCYTLFVAYGPRILLQGTVEQPMYEWYPETQDVTAAVSAETNVFPSLHTALAVVVLLFAWRTRGEYPWWFVLAAVGSTSVVLSTMVLGIHWLVDVVAGVLLAVASVWAASGIVSRVEGAGEGDRDLRGGVCRRTQSGSGD